MKIYQDFDLTNFNSYRIHAICKRAFFPNTEQDIQTIFINYAGPKKIILGSGNNVILSKPYYEDDFIIFSGNFDSAEVSGLEIIAQSGVFMLDLSELALANNLSGLELFYDIPSSLGGAIVMNAGASGEEIKDLLIKVRYYDPIADEFSEIIKEDIDFEYRNSFFQRNPHLIVTVVWLSLKNGEGLFIKEKMERNKEVRWAKQPKEFPNAGSVFKRPKGFYVGALMEELSLKGYSIGGAKISEKHGGFIVNFNGASGEDILGIIAHARRLVMEKYGVELEIEQRII